MTTPTHPATQPDAGGHFGPYGGRYVPEVLMAPLEDLEDAYLEARADPSFQAELSDLLGNYAGRPTPLYHAKRLCARYVRYGDRICFPLCGSTRREWDAVVSHSPQGHKSVFVVHLADGPGRLSLRDLDSDLAQGCHLLLQVVMPVEFLGHRREQKSAGRQRRDEAVGVIH